MGSYLAPIQGRTNTNLIFFRATILKAQFIGSDCSIERTKLIDRLD